MAIAHVPVACLTPHPLGKGTQNKSNQHLFRTVLIHSF